MESITLNVENVTGFIPESEIEKWQSATSGHLQHLIRRDGQGNDFLGWLNLPSSITDQHMEKIEASALKLRQSSDVVVVIGIGGSYLGARAVNDALSHSFSAMGSGQKNPRMIFAGHNIGEDYMHELLEMLEEKEYSLIVISKSGTTTEPAIAFRILRENLESRLGKEKARSRIIAITDQKKGALRQLADEEGYDSFVIPDDIGGRYSVLTPVGLVPLAACGFDIRSLVKGAAEMESRCLTDAAFSQNPATLYAAARNLLYRQGKKVEILVNYNPKLHYLAEWWKQLYGESEGKELKGIFPAAVDNSTDLHSLGQYIQEGERMLFETVLSVREPDHRLTIPGGEANLDNLNYLAGKRIDEVNKMAELGTTLAHVDGGVPNMKIELPKINAFFLGQLMYFFELACGVSGYLLGVNPFNQPGVEAYKKNMFALLEKPGFEEETRKIKNRG